MTLQTKGQYMSAWPLRVVSAVYTHEYEPSSTDVLTRCHCYQEPSGTWLYVGGIDGDSGDASGYQIRGMPTLSQASPTLLRNASTSDFYDMLVSAKFEPPTALSEGGLWHQSGLISAATASMAEWLQEMKHMLACTKSPWLSRRHRELP